MRSTLTSIVSPDHEISAVGLEACASAIANIAYADDARQACVECGGTEALCQLLKGNLASEAEEDDTHRSAKEAAARALANITLSEAGAQAAVHAAGISSQLYALILTMCSLSYLQIGITALNDLACASWASPEAKEEVRLVNSCPGDHLSSGGVACIGECLNAGRGHSSMLGSGCRRKLGAAITGPTSWGHVALGEHVNVRIRRARWRQGNETIAMEI